MECKCGNDENLRPGGEMVMICRYGNRTGFLGVLVPSVSIKDRTIVGPVDHA